GKPAHEASDSASLCCYDICFSHVITSAFFAGLSWGRGREPFDKAMVTEEKTFVKKLVKKLTNANVEIYSEQMSTC
ncbi:hypothetical protein LI237_16345, partial [Anaerostipes caccae]|uniref:hypothetical protein n=1 Tax=Anaerostipes caccae TaxID=105841 RepID=UPI001D065890